MSTKKLGRPRSRPHLGRPLTAAERAAASRRRRKDGPSNLTAIWFETLEALAEVEAARARKLLLSQLVPGLPSIIATACKHRSEIGAASLRRLVEAILSREWLPGEGITIYDALACGERRRKGMRDGDIIVTSRNASSEPTG